MSKSPPYCLSYIIASDLVKVSYDENSRQKHTKQKEKALQTSPYKPKYKNCELADTELELFFGGFKAVESIERQSLSA